MVVHGSSCFDTKGIRLTKRRHALRGPAVDRAEWVRLVHVVDDDDWRRRGSLLVTMLLAPAVITPTDRDGLISRNVENLRAALAWPTTAAFALNATLLMLFA
jgi:hypothetical protein